MGAVSNYSNGNSSNVVLELCLCMTMSFSLGGTYEVLRDSGSWSLQFTLKCSAKIKIGINHVYISYGSTSYIEREKKRDKAHVAKCKNR